VLLVNQCEHFSHLKRYQRVVKVTVCMVGGNSILRFIMATLGHEPVVVLELAMGLKIVTDT
jgi:hypothetical protein